MIFITQPKCWLLKYHSAKYETFKIAISEKKIEIKMTKNEYYLYANYMSIYQYNIGTRFKFFDSTKNGRYIYLYKIKYEIIMKHYCWRLLRNTTNFWVLLKILISNCYFANRKIVKLQ